MKILVTGGAGFIGSNLCRRLLSEPAIDAVRVIDDLSTGFEDNLVGLDVDLRVGSILDSATLQGAAEGVDSIVHLAALGSVPRSVADPLQSHEVNATGTLMVLQAARLNDNAHVVLASSSSVYGSNPVLPKDEALTCMPMSPYAVSKLAAEQYAMAFAHCYDLPVLPFRFFNVYGPRQRAGQVYAAVIPVFLDAALRGHPLPVNGDGQQSRDFTFVGTVADVLTQAVTRRLTAGPTNLAFGSRTTLLELIEMISAATSDGIDISWRDARPGDVRDSRADNSRLLQLVGPIAEHRLEDGLRETARWMQTVLADR